jgi:hypothetical protein
MENGNFSTTFCCWIFRNLLGQLEHINFRVFFGFGLGLIWGMKMSQLTPLYGAPKVKLSNGKVQNQSGHYPKFYSPFHT